MTGRHRFRFFVDVAASPGARVSLDPADIAHARVLRLGEGDHVDLVDEVGRVWDARIAGDRLEIGSLLGETTEPAAIELIAGALVGGKFDELVDGAVQAGAARIVPLATSRRDVERLGARRSRLQRIARSAAKQAHRTIIPEVAEPIDIDALLNATPGIVLDASAASLLDHVVASQVEAEVREMPFRLLVGPADGLDATLMSALTGRGWQRARLGPTVLRAELAAAVAVAIVAMHAPARTSDVAIDAGVGCDG